VKFQYCLVRTSEGFGVLHFLYRGSFIPVEWLRHAWYDIHHAFEVDIRRVYSEGIVRYMVVQYMSSQSGYVRGSSSRLWIFRGAARVFRHLLKVCGYVGGLADWKGILLFQSILELSGIG